MKYIKLTIFLLLILTASCQKTSIITLESLLNEMASVDQIAQFPDPYYTCHQASSYDRGSVSPDSALWMANSDGYVGGNFIRIDTINGRIEKVMLDHDGPGVITRIWITSLDKRPVIRFYFDGKHEPGYEIPAWDMTQMGIPGVGENLAFPHTSWSEEYIGGSTSYFPIPYANSCKITVEIPIDVDQNPRYYQVNYRKYEEKALLETFSPEKAQELEIQIKTVNDKLGNKDIQLPELDLLEEKEKLIQGDSILLITSRGKKAIYELQLDIDIQDSSAYASVMHQLILSAQFDGKQTIWAPLSDFSGGGMGAPMVESWFISSDGKGRITSRWVMPYKKEAIVCLKNLSDQEVGVHMQIKTAPYKWDSNTLYFHTSWKQNNNLHLFHCADDVSNPDAYPFNMITITGKGVMRGDLLSLINYSQSWYGEGDETIWVDEDTFPSHFGTGTEDYYNSSWAPVYVFHTPFGGAIRADSTNSRGHNTWLRTRNLDEIPFRKHLKFDFELLSWFVGEADYSSTIFWYGDKDAHALGSSRIEDAKRMLETR